MKQYRYSRYCFSFNNIEDKLGRSNLRKFCRRFIQIHIAYAKKEPSFMVLYLQKSQEAYGYDMSPGTLYPILHSMENKGLLTKVDRNVDGK